MWLEDWIFHGLLEEEGRFSDTHINESDSMREIALSILGVEYRDNTLQLT